MTQPPDADKKLALWDDTYDPRYVAELMAEMQRRGLNPSQAKARAKSELLDAGNQLDAVSELLEKADALMKGKPLSHEYLDEAWAEARKLLPPWAWTQIHRAAMPRAGARASIRAREDEPSTFEKMALSDIQPRTLRALSEDELRMAWLRLHQWYATAQRARRPVEDYVNAALWTMDEMSRRGLDVERDDALVRAVEELRGKRSSTDTFAKLRELPVDLVVVRDFISVVGSTAKGTKPPEDLDLLMRAPWDEASGQVSIQAENIWLPVRNVLDPDKRGALHWIANPQGAHGDFIPVYDLVLRRRDKLAAEVVKFEEDQPRDEAGRWAPDGGGSKSGGERLRSRGVKVVRHGEHGTNKPLYERAETEVADALEDIESQGFRIPDTIGVVLDAGPIGEFGGAVPSGSTTGREVSLNVNRDPKNWRHATIHEVGHIIYPSRASARTLTNDEADVARRVSRYASTNSNEFVAETFAAIVERRGAIDRDVARLYRSLGGPTAQRVEKQNKGTIEARKLLDDAIRLNSAMISGESPMTPEAHAQLAILLDTARGELSAEKTEKALGPEPLRVDLGCGSAKPEGYLGIDKVAAPGVDRVADLEAGIPLPDGSVDELRANHFLEHVADKERLMREAHRVLKPGGCLVFEVPSTKGEGAFAHPSHKSWWNKSSFAFWTQPELLEDRPRFEVEALDEEQRGDLCYVRGVLRKPMDAQSATVVKAMRPFGDFTPPKPEVPYLTELFETAELWEWARQRLPVYVEPKHNGFRAILEKSGERARLWFEGARTDVMDRFPGLREAVGKLPGDFVLDLDVGVAKDGKRLPRPALMKLNRERPELASDEKLELTVFDLPFRGEDLSGEPFEERRRELESFFDDALKGASVFKLSPAKLVKTRQQLDEATPWAFEQDRSEGLVAKSAAGRYETDGSTNEWSKLKRVAELKVIVLDVERTKDGAYTYRGGLLPGDLNVENLLDYGGKRYVDLGRTFNSEVEAKPGDILTVKVLELIPDEEKGTLVWLGPTVVDVDESRKEPYVAAQALDIATRAKVVQKQEAQVPSLGRPGARMLFVGSSPGPQEAARREPFVGQAGDTLREKYLAPLGLGREDVALTNAVPLILKDDSGRVREPTEAEVAEWSGWLNGELERLKPRVVVALGKVARDALGERADVWLPHPSAVRRFGDSGEVARKLSRVREMLKQPALKAQVQKQPERGEGGKETRGFNAFRTWERTWQEQLPLSGKGRFVYQHHWRGLDEKQARNATDEELLGTDHSLHADLRLEGQDGQLWGWAVFIGSAKDNRAAGGDKLLAMSDGKLRGQDKLQLANKLPQPKEWLDVGVGKPLAVAPGGVGATANTWSKFFALDSGNFELGVARQHSVEVVLDGKRLHGRFVLQFAPIGDRRAWLIDKPADQQPMAETRQLADVVGEVKQRGQRYLFWGKPGETPQRIDVRTGRVLKSALVPLLKERALEDKRIVYGSVLDPYVVDTQDDWVSPNDVEETAHGWFLGSRLVTLHHRTHADAQAVESSIVEYPSRRDYMAARVGEPHRVYRRKYGDDVVHSGAWLLGVKLSPELWEAYKRGEIAAFSIEGFGVRVPTTTKAMPQVEFVDLVEAKK